MEQSPPSESATVSVHFTRYHYKDLLSKTLPTESCSQKDDDVRHHSE